MDAAASEISLARHGNLLIIVHVSTLTLTAVKQMSAEMDAMARQHPSGICLLGLVLHSEGRPPAEIRDEIAAMMSRLSSHLASGAVVFLATGVLSSIRRAVAQTLILATRNQKLRVAQNLPEGVKFVQPKVQPAMGEDRIVALAETMIARAQASVK